MAFETTAAQQSRFPTSANTTGQNDQWKADGFLNLYIPTSGGKRRKLGYIPLKHARAFDASILERLESGGEEAIKALAAVLEIEYHSAEGEESAKAAF